MKIKLKAAGKSLSKYFHNYRHDVYLVITLAFIVIVGCCFINSHLRVIESFRDLATSFGVYFTILEDGDATVNNVSMVDLGDLGIIPQDINVFIAQMKLYGQALINWFSWRFYFNDVMPGVAIALQVIMTLMMFVLLFLLITKLSSNKKQKGAYDDTDAVKWVQRHVRQFKRTGGAWIMSMVTFLKDHKAYYIIWILTWAYAFNGFTICLEFLAYYLYFSATFDIPTLIIQVYKLLLDLSVIVRFFPTWMWVIFGLVIFNVIRHWLAFQKVKKNEEKCEDAVKNFPISSLICGPMGTKKTTFMSDVAITANMLFRQKAYDIIFDCDLKFPDFPWQNVEKYASALIESHSIYNLASCRKAVRRLESLYKLSVKGVHDGGVFRAFRHLYGNIYTYSNLCFDYPEDCRHEYISDVGTKTIWDVIETYVCAFFIYCISTTMLISNYSIRVDDYIKDDGCFPKWDIDFFRKDKQKAAREHSRYSHILDFDALRLGKIMKCNNKMKDAIDFGIIAITEVGKERGNQLTVKARNVTLDDGEATQTNDFMNLDVKLCRHRATVDNFPFVLFLLDENRAASLNADFKGLCDVVYIAKSTDWTINTTLFGLDELVYDVVTKLMKKLYLNIKNKRGGMNVPGYLLKCAYRLLWRHYQIISTRYSLSTLTLCISDGESDKGKGDSKYKLSKWKIHNCRFTTDALGAFYRYKTARSLYGICDIPEYSGLRATLPELKSGHSFLINDLTDAFISDKKQDETVNTKKSA